MSRQVIIVGTGGQGKVVADIVLRSGDQVLGFLDDKAKPDQRVLGIPVLGKVADFTRYLQAEFVAAVGDAASRSRIVQALQGVKWYTAIHPAAVISPLGTQIGEGSMIGPGAVVNPCAQVGRHCIINTHAAVEHDCRIGDFCHVSVGAKLGGGVTLGDHTWVGIGATSLCGLHICGNTMIGAGAVVVRDISEPGTYIGVPARRKK